MPGTEARASRRSLRKFACPGEATIPRPLCGPQALTLLGDISEGVIAHHYRIQSLKGVMRLAV